MSEKIDSVKYKFQKTRPIHFSYNKFSTQFLNKIFIFKKMRFGQRLLNRQIPELGKWNRISGNYNAGSTILPPKIREEEREAAIEELWREAKNEMWLTRERFLINSHAHGIRYSH